MGLLDGFLGAPGSDQAQAIGLLSAGLINGNFGNGLLAANQVFSPENRLRSQLGQMQLAQAQLGLEQARRNSADDEAVRAAAKSSYVSPDAALARSTGPMPDGSAVPQVQPGFDNRAFLGQLWGAAPTRALQYEQAMAKESPFAKVDPKDYTPDSVRAFMAAGGRDFSVLKTAPKEQAAPAAIQEYNFAKAQGFPGTFEQWQIAQKQAGATKLNVGVNADKSYFGNVAEGLAKNDVGMIETARSAPDRIATAQKVKTILQQSPITGTGAEARLSLNKALATAGVIDGKNVADTETLTSMLASQTLDAIKSSGLGSGQGFTDKDRQFLERARSGNIEMNGETLRRLADLNENSARASIRRGNTVIEKLRQSPQAGAFGQQLDPIEEPAAQQGSPTKLIPSLPKTAPVGTRARDTQTGQVLRFNGMSWLPEK